MNYAERSSVHQSEALHPLNVRFYGLLYDPTSTCFESDPRFSNKRRFRYSREKRPDCVRVIMALVVTR